MLAHRRHTRSFSWPRTFSPVSLASCQPPGLPCARTTDAEPIIGIVGRSFADIRGPEWADSPIWPAARRSVAAKSASHRPPIAHRGAGITAPTKTQAAVPDETLATPMKARLLIAQSLVEANSQPSLRLVAPFALPGRLAS
jgi:hypothetical protein